MAEKIKVKIDGQVLEYGENLTLPSNGDCNDEESRKYEKILNKLLSKKNGISPTQASLLSVLILFCFVVYLMILPSKDGANFISSWWYIILGTSCIPYLIYAFYHSSGKFMYFTFGKYDNKNLLWKIINVKNGAVLLLSKSLVERKAYNDTLEDVVWGKCTLRKWLNNDFYNQAFSEDEKKYILTTISEGNFEDHVYILSKTEISKYGIQKYPSSNIYGYIKLSKNETMWIRNEGTAIVNVLKGNPDSNEQNKIDSKEVNEESGVLPAIWIKLNAATYEVLKRVLENTGR